MQYSVDLGNRPPVSRVYIDWKLQSNIYLYVLQKIDCIIVSRFALSCAVELQRVSIALLLVCLSSDVEVNPSPVGTSSIPYSIPGRYLEHKDRIGNNGGCVLMNVISSYNNV